MVLKHFGALVQLVRIRACHARGQGFESPTHRKEEDRKVFLFCFLSGLFFLLHSNALYSVVLVA